MTRVPSGHLFSGSGCAVIGCRLAQCRLARCCGLVGSDASRGNLGLKFISGRIRVQPTFSFGFLKLVIPVGLVRLRLGGLGEFSSGQRGLPDDLKPPVVAGP